MSQRILFLTCDFPPMVGGAGNLQYEVVRHFTVPVQVMVWGPHRADAFDRAQPFPIFRYNPALSRLRLPKVRGASLLAAHIRHVAPRLMSFRLTQLHVGYPTTDHLRLAFWARRLWRVPYMVYTYGKEVLSVQGEPLRYLCAADRVYTISAYTKERLLERGVPEAAIVQIMPAVEEVFLTPAAMDAAPPHAGLDGHHAFTVLTVGRLEPRKGQDQVLRALALLGPQAHGWRYVVAGDGPSRASLEALAQELGVAPRVHFLGQVSQADLLNAYRGCDVFIMPNRQVGDSVEGFGLVFLEANAAGKPVIGGRSGGAPDAIADGQTGLLVDPEDVGAIARALQRLHDDPALRHALGQAGRRRVEALPRWTAIARQLERALAPGGG